MDAGKKDREIGPFALCRMQNKSGFNRVSLREVVFMQGCSQTRHEFPQGEDFYTMMSTPRLFFAAAAAFSWLSLPLAAHAQAAAPSLQPVAFSSSVGQNPFAGEDIDGRELASAPNGSLGSTTRTMAPGQYSGGGYGGGRYHPYSDNSRWSHVVFEVGGGFTAPIGNSASGGFTSIIGDGNRYGTTTWGGNLMGGAGWSFSKNFSLLGEFSYNTNKIPGRTLSAYYNLISGGAVITDGSGDTIPSIGGNVHTYTISAEPVFYYYNSDKHKYAGYVLGGVGWSHKSVNFTAPVISQDYYGNLFQTNQTFSSYADSGVSFNGGTGVSFKPLGQYSSLKLFAEARFMFVDTPRETAADIANPNKFILHTGTEELIPVSVGIRF